MVLPVRIRLLIVTVLMVLPGALGVAADPPSAVGAMLTLLKSGRVPESRQSTIVKLICDRGNEHDLRYIFDLAVGPGDWPKELRQEALQGIIEAARTREIRPAGDLSNVTQLLSSADLDMVRWGIELSGQWKVESAFSALQKLAAIPDTAADQKQLLLAAMSKISPEKTSALLIELAEPAHSFSTRSGAIQTLASIDVEQAAALAAKALRDASPHDSPAQLLDGFLDLEGGTTVLASQLKEQPPSADVAKLSLRYLYSLGRTDPALNDFLSEVAGIAGDPAPPTAKELAELIDEVERAGDAERGEDVFRRADLSCMKCHAVSKAGGQIGPDLSAIGASSPVDYLVMSILEPDQAIKEAYTTKVVVTLQGKVYQGLVEDRTTTTLSLKDATGKVVVIPVNDIDDEIEGKSLMPRGLAKFMTHQELLDLTKFLSMLGKPGEYAVRSTPRMQRWRLLKSAPQELIDEVPSIASFEDLVLLSKNWDAVYGRVNGELSVDELTQQTGQEVIYLQGEIDVMKAGPIQGNLNSMDGITLWVGDQQMPQQTEFVWEASLGIVPVTLRIDSAAIREKHVRLEFSRPAGSASEFSVVDGQ